MANEALESWDALRKLLSDENGWASRFSEHLTCAWPKEGGWRQRGEGWVQWSRARGVVERGGR